MVVAKARWLQQQIVHIALTAAASEQSFEVAVDGFNHSHRYFRPAVVQDALETVEQHLGQFPIGFSRCQRAPDQSTLQVAQRGTFVGVIPQLGEALLEEIG